VPVVADEETALAEQLMEVATAAAVEVGEMLAEAFRERSSFRAKRDSHDLVTEFDVRAEQEIRAYLTDHVPGSSVWGEEDGLVGSGDVAWYVDPIDGTNNFVAGIPFFCTSIAAVYRNRVAAAVIYDPIRAELFSADLNGASCNGSPLQSTGATVDTAAVLGTDFPTHIASVLAGNGRPDFDRFAELVQSFQTVRRLGSGALMLAYVAAGRIDVTFATTANPWDVAAGLLLVGKAGGTYHALPGTVSNRQRPWEAATYIAHVGNFDVEGSCLREILRLGE
jgi:myo-inositol-1(or 4)-monophosphatase